MTKRRPASHVIAALYFLTLAVAFSFAGYQMYEQRNPAYSGQFIMAAPFVIGLLVLLTTNTARWSFWYCSLLIFSMPMFFVGSIAVILFKVPDVAITTLVPTIFGACLLFTLFYFFTFGDASKSFYSGRDE